MGFLLTLLIFAVLFVLSELLRPKPEIQNAKPAGLGDFNFPTATEGRSVPRMWGTVRIAGPNVVWYGDLRTIAITEKVKTGLFSSSRVTVGFRYVVGMQFALCRGPVDQLRKVWVGDDVLFDRTGTPIVHDGTETFNDPGFFGGDDTGGNGGMSGTVLFKSGLETQTIASYLATFQKVGGDTPAYRGVCYVCPNTSAFYVGNSASIRPWKFEIRRIVNVIPDPLDQNGGGNNYFILVNGADTNPAQALYEIMTDKLWGLGFDHESMDTQTFIDAANVCSGEGNGFSMILDAAQEASDMIRTIAEQMDAVVVQNPLTGLWTVTMIRPAADLPTAPPAPKVIDGSNLIKLENFTRGAWDGTVNQLLLEFFDRDDDYKQTFAGAQDMGNIRIQEENVRAQVRFPGVKDKTLANDLAWRELLTQSYPLVKCSVIVDRSFWDSQIADVVFFTDATLGISDFAMRIAAVNLGNLTEGEIRLDLVEDIFRNVQGAFGDVPNSGWVDPVSALEAFDFELAFEAPRAFAARILASPEEAVIWGTARVKGSESGYDSYARKAADAFAKTGDSVGFMVIGKLKAALTKSELVPWNPGTAFVVKPDPDDLDVLFDAFDFLLSPSSVGTNLANLIMLNGEFIFVTAAAKVSGELQLNTVYRGAIDSIQADHAIDDLVYVLSAGGNLFTAVTWSAADVVDTKLLPKSLAGILDIGDATEIENTMAKRARKPYPPVWYKLNNSQLAYPASLDLEAGAGTWDTDGTDFTVSRRDYRITDEVSHMIADAATLATGFPAVEQHVTRYEVTKDYSGSPVVLFTDEDNTTAFVVLRNKILRYNAGAVPAELQFRIYARHVDSAETLDSIQEYIVQIPTITATSLTGLFNMGADAAAAVSNSFSAPSAGTYTGRIQTAVANNIEYRVNGGAWATLITGGGTTGTTVAVVATDTIELRHSETTVDLIQLLYLKDDTAAADVAYWVPYV